jgi:uncharacterized protein (DUF427 family)
VARSNAFANFPDHRIEIDDSPIHARVTRDGRVLAETTAGLNMREGKYPAVVYFPREDVFMQHLERTEHSTHCPFKGDASYFDVGASEGGETIREVAWSYETPFDQMKAIRDHLAFYVDRVEIEIIQD